MLRLLPPLIARYAAANVDTLLFADFRYAIFCWSHARHARLFIFAAIAICYAYAAEARCFFAYAAIDGLPAADYAIMLLPPCLLPLLLLFFALLAVTPCAMLLLIEAACPGCHVAARCLDAMMRDAMTSAELLYVNAGRSCICYAFSCVRLRAYYASLMPYDAARLLSLLPCCH